MEYYSDAKKEWSSDTYYNADESWKLTNLEKPNIYPEQINPQKQKDGGC
jgi:hypothetical protein